MSHCSAALYVALLDQLDLTDVTVVGKLDRRLDRRRDRRC